jgi:hypothetical protein
MKKLTIIFFLVFLAAGKSFFQKDTIVIIKTDTIYIPEKQDIIYKLYLENKELEITHLWKVDFVDFSFLKPNLGFEQRLYKSWSIEGIASYGYSYTFVNDFIEDMFNLSPKVEYEISLKDRSFEFEQLFKYYFNLKKRERLGLKTNGFCGNYFATSILYNQRKFIGEGYVSNASSFHYFSPINVTQNNFNIGLKYGIQRRIGNFVFIEFYTGCYINFRTDKFDNVANPYKSQNIYPFVGLRFGFAIGSFDNLKKNIYK